MRSLAWAALALALAAGPAAAEEACPFPGQRPMLAVQLFFGQTVPGRGLLGARQWRHFLAETVTPALPDGFTVLHASGQWRDGRTGRIGREPTEVLLVAAPDSPEFRARVQAVAEAYRVRFHQQSVGVLAQPGCGAF